MSSPNSLVYPGFTTAILTELMFPFNLNSYSLFGYRIYGTSRVKIIPYFILKQSKAPLYSSIKMIVHQLSSIYFALTS